MKEDYCNGANRINILLSYQMEEKPSFNYINQISGGDVLFKKSLVDIFKKETSKEIESYQLHLKNGNYPKTSEVVHKLCHKIKILDLKNGFKIAEKHSIQLKDNNQSLKMDFERILTIILLFIKNA